MKLYNTRNGKTISTKKVKFLSWSDWNRDVKPKKTNKEIVVAYMDYEIYKKMIKG